MWTCPGCGERLEEPFDTCWKCGTFREDPSSTKRLKQRESAEEQAADYSQTSSASEPQGNVLDQILLLQRQQQETLNQIHWKVGCLFAYMVVGILIGILAAFLTVI